MKVRLLVGILALLLAPNCVAAAPDVAGGADLAGLERFPRAWIVAYERDEEFAPREFVVSAVEKIRRELRIEQKLRVEAARLRITYQVAAGTPLAEVIGHYQQALGPQALFSCRGRDCGRSNGWANQVFAQAVLYGPEANQFYIAADRGGELVSVYVIQRGNKRIYAHVEALRPRRAVDLIHNTNLVAELAGNGYAVVDGVRPRLDGTIASDGLAVLAGLAPRLASFERLTLYVVCHLYGADAGDVLLQRSAACAEEASGQLQVELDGQAGPELTPFGAGPLLPRADGAVPRIELVLPHRQQRD